MKRQLALFVFLALTIILVGEASALYYHLRPPKMILYANVTKDSPGMTKGFFEIKNKNNITLNVTLAPDENLKNVINIDTPQLLIEPNQSTFANFTGKVLKPGRYQGVILATYSAQNHVPVVLEAQIIVVAAGEEYVERKWPLSNYQMIGLVLALLALLAVLIFLSKKPKKHSSKKPKKSGSN